MISPLACLEHGDVQSLLGGDLPPAEMTAAELHLSTCGHCRARLETAIGDADWWQEARESLGEVSPRRAARDEDGEPLAANSPADVLALLGPTDDPRMLGRIGAYEIVGILGRGGMGVVFKGFDAALNRYVAIKMLLPHLAASGASRKRFAREAQAAAAVVNDHVMAIHNVAEWQGVPYFVMPYARGMSLQKRLDEQGPLDLREILRIGQQTAKGLAAAHSQGLVHRDVKPANILLSENVERVTLTDFGLARAVDDVALTRVGTLAGTPQYMSPEQARGQSVDFRSDLFSLGSVLYALCTGRAPFRADSSYGVLRLITDNEPRPIPEINPDIPQWLCSIVARLMAKRAEDRYGSAQEVAALLEACLAHVQQPMTSPLPAELAAKTPRSFGQAFNGPFLRKALVMLATAGVVVLGMFLFQASEPPSIAGEWQGEEWGHVVLRQTAASEYAGTYSDTFGPKPGELALKWSRIERRFNGSWREGEDRFGEISVKLEGETIKGALTTDAKSKINPATPRLAHLEWRRRGVDFVGNIQGGVEHPLSVEQPVRGATLDEPSELRADEIRLKGATIRAGAGQVLLITPVPEALEREEIDRRIRQSLLGAWRATLPPHEEGGEERVIRLVFSAEIVEFHQSDPPPTVDRAVYKLNTNTMPMQIDLSDIKSERQETQALGLLELDGDTLRVCWGKERPDKLAPGDHALYAEFKREVSPAEAADKLLSKLQGDWRATLMIDEQGNRVEDFLLGIDDDFMSFVFMKYRMRLDATRSPPTVDLIDAYQNDHVRLGLVAVEGDKLRLCFGAGPDIPRCKELAAAKDYLYAELVRDPPPNSAPATERKSTEGTRETPAAAATELEGLWDLDYLPEDAAPLPDQRTRLVYSGDLHATFQGNRLVALWRMKLDLKASPKRISLEGDRPMRGIYEIVGDGLRLCLAQPDDVYPTRFGTERPEFKRVTVQPPRELLDQMLAASVKLSGVEPPPKESSGVAVAPDIAAVVAAMGLQLQPAKPEAFANQMTFRGGLQVTAVREDSLAAKVGLKVDDIIVGVDKWETHTLDHLGFVLAKTGYARADAPSKDLKLHLLRGDTVFVATLPAFARDKNAELPSETDENDRTQAGN